MGFAPPPGKFVVGDTVIPMNYGDVRLHQVGYVWGTHKRYITTLCGIRVTTNWEHADTMDFDNSMLCQRCDAILEVRREDKLARDHYPAEDHVRNALQQKDRLIERKDGEIKNLTIREGSLVQQRNKLDVQIRNQKELIERLRERLKEENQVCKDCGREIWADAGGNYHHVEDPQKGCFLIQPEVIRVSPMYDMPMTPMQLKATGWVDDGKGNQFQDRRGKEDRRQLFPDDRRTSADRRRADGE